MSAPRKENITSPQRNECCTKPGLPRRCKRLQESPVLIRTQQLRRQHFDEQTRSQRNVAASASVPLDASLHCDFMSRAAAIRTQAAAISGSCLKTRHRISTGQHAGGTFCRPADHGAPCPFTKRLQILTLAATDAGYSVQRPGSRVHEDDGGLPHGLGPAEEEKVHFQSSRDVGSAR